MEKKLSASSINMFLSCPLLYKFVVIDGIQGVIDSPHLVYGTALHKAIEVMHKSIYNGNLISKSDIEGIFVDSWEIGLELNPDPIRWWKSTQEEEMKAVGIQSAGMYHDVHKNDEPPPTYINQKEEKVPAVEIPFLLNLKNLIGRDDWSLSGIIDRLFIEDGGIVLEDHKTGTSKYSDFQVKTNLQLAIYSWAFRELVNEYKFPQFSPGTVEKYVQFDVISKKKPEIYYHSREIGSRTLNHLRHIISTIINQIEREEFLPDYGQNCAAYGGCGLISVCGDFKYE